MKRNRLAGHTMIEVMVSVMLMGLITTSVISGLIIFSRSEKAIYNQIRVSDNARRFMQRLASDMSDSISISTGTSTQDLVNVVRLTSTTVYRYVDRDNNVATIKDNQIERITWNGTTTNTDVMLSLCSPLPGVPVFQYERNVPAQLLLVSLRVGDRTNPPSAADNAETGRGYQSYVLRQSVSREEPYDN